VVSGRLYEIRFWVRGQGRITTSVFDGRAEDNGVAPYNSLVEVTGDDVWQQVIQPVFVTATTTMAEFMFRVEGVSGTDFLVIDDMLIARSALPDPAVVSISQIQTTTSPFGYSPLNFQLVRTSGVVTAIGAICYFIQDGAGPWSGIQVQSPPPTDLVVGDSITVMGTVAESQGVGTLWPATVTQLIGVQQVLMHSATLMPPPATDMTATEVAAEAWEGVLVRIADLRCMDLPVPLPLEWTAANWQGSIVVDDLLYLHTPVVGDHYTISGIAHYDGLRKLLPRSAADIEIGVGVPHTAASAWAIHPNPAHDRLHITWATMGIQGQLLVTDMQGRTVMSRSGVRDNATLDVSALPTGPYILHLVQGVDVSVRRFHVLH
jgi:hypothetical protein